MCALQYAGWSFDLAILHAVVAYCIGTMENTFILTIPMRHRVCSVISLVTHGKNLIYFYFYTPTSTLSTFTHNSRDDLVLRLLILYYRFWEYTFSTNRAGVCSIFRNAAPSNHRNKYCAQSASDVHPWYESTTRTNLCRTGWRKLAQGLASFPRIGANVSFVCTIPNKTICLSVQLFQFYQPRIVTDACGVIHSVGILSPRWMRELAYLGKLNIISNFGLLLTRTEPGPQKNLEIHSSSWRIHQLQLCCNRTYKCQRRP